MSCAAAAEVMKIPAELLDVADVFPTYTTARARGSMSIAPAIVRSRAVLGIPDVSRNTQTTI
jgi:hypothetical protein